ncbi:integral membrane sensor signal transduction histidine kinase [Nostoc sp. NIES-3756]|uniref:ATP-binding protein n=1 Tax=Nostoc sp. NIES-3756 TaxID=1751286 RepID=UPI0007218CD0|nr:ATP-binding protein [Nostoc sp. NIES-3756]BAT54385.1 integral membrane sensor signal transduction histidine kinase [Nostoc sp. NIES-3756]
MTNFIVIPYRWLKRGTHNFSISQKIAYGYALSLSIAIVGTVAGLIVGDFYQTPAQHQKGDAQYEISLLYRLQTAVLQARTSQQQFVYFVNQPQLLKKEYSNFSKYAVELKQVWFDVQSYINTVNYQQEKHTEGLPSFIKTYSDIPNVYIQEVETLVQTIVDKDVKIKDVQATQKLLSNFSTSSIALKYDLIDDELLKIIQASYQDNKNAEIYLENVLKFRFWIITTSIFLSVISAAILAIYTSRLLVMPITAVTNVAQKTTEELKFDILAPVMTTDEIGVLANSFNKLIERIAEYTHELDLARETLESRVEERTQELSKALESLQHTQSQLVQAEKMSSLGQLVAGIAHEINNPVNFIFGNLTHVNEYVNNLLSLIDIYQEYQEGTNIEISELIEEIDLDYICDDLPKILTSMKVGADRIREIVLALRNFSRLDEAEMKLVNIHEGIDSTLLFLYSSFKTKYKKLTIEVVKEYGELPLVECYAGQLNQVFMNILTNSMYALNQQCQYNLRGEQENKSNHITIRTEVIENNYVRICFKDNGPGIAASIRKQIFDPFFTTKPIGEGTGLGLSISYQIVVEKHRGKLKCLSAPEEGCEFQIEIPIHQKVKLA